MFNGVGVFVDVDEGGMFEMIGIWGEVEETVVVGEMIFFMIGKITLCGGFHGMVGFVLYCNWCTFFHMELGTWSLCV